MTHFPMTYLGNKRKETYRVLDLVNLSNYTTIVEPFAGSAAFSFACWRKGFRGLFIINDLDPRLIELYNFIRSEGVRPLFQYCINNCNEESWKLHNSKKNDPNINLFEWFYEKKVRGDFGRQNMPKKWPALKPSQIMLDFEQFIQTANIVLSCMDYTSIMLKHSINVYALIFLDPPYFSSHNQQYFGRASSHGSDGEYLDATWMYCYFADLMESYLPAHLILIINSPEIIRRLYKKFINVGYRYAYGASAKRINGKFEKNKTTHIIVNSRFDIDKESQIVENCNESSGYDEDDEGEGEGIDD